MAQFDYIGTYDRLSRDWTATMAHIGIAPAMPRRELNRTADLAAEYDARISEILNDHEMIDQLRDLFVEDFRVHERYER